MQRGRVGEYEKAQRRPVFLVSSSFSSALLSHGEGAIKLRIFSWHGVRTVHVRVAGGKVNFDPRPVTASERD